jgi:glutathione S-transferase
MLTIYGCSNTRSCRVLWALEEANVEYEYIEVNLRTGAGRQPQYLGLNPGGKVPTLVDGDFILTESAAICTYIGDRFPSARLTPPVGTQNRAHYDQWCYFALSELEQPLWTIAKHTFALPEQLRVPAVIETATWEFAVAAKVLAAGLDQREFIIGDGFTATDILIAHTLDWALVFNLPLTHENLAAYATRLLARPARKRALERERAENGAKS